MSRRVTEPEYKIRANKRSDAADGKPRFTPQFQDENGRWLGINKGFFTSKPAALVAAHDAAKEYFESGIDQEIRNLTVDQFWENVYSGHLGGLGKSSQYSYPSIYAKWIKPHFGRLVISRVQVHHVQTWVNMLNEQVASYGSREKYYNCLSGILTYAVVNKARTENPCATKSLRASLGARIDPPVLALEKHEFDALLAEIPEHYKPFVLATAGIGARPNEIVALRPRDIDWETGVVDINHGEIVVSKKKFGTSTVTTPYPKDKEPRKVPMHPKTLQVLDDLRIRRGLSKDSEQRLFVAERGGAINRNVFNYRIMKPALERAGLPRKYSLKSLRATYVSWLLDAGVEVHVVMEAVGHSKHQTTKRYTKTFDNKNDKIIAGLDKIENKPHLEIVKQAS